MQPKYRIFIATFPFGKSGRKPLELLENSEFELIFNPLGRRLKQGEVLDFIQNVDAVIAGTEPYTEAMLTKTKLKVISRVGIGLDNVPLQFCKEHGISVTYTPDAPSQAVAELTVANIINLSRHILASDHSVREGAWNRYMGYLLEELTIGVIGIGRIGKRVCQLLQPFKPNLLVCDIKPDDNFIKTYNLKLVSKEALLKTADMVTLHIPYNKSNHHFLNRQAFHMMKTGSFVINTSRGGVIDDTALTDALLQKHLAGAALDVFIKEPYDGPLRQMENVILTAHMGASARKSRYLMELGAAEDCIRVLMDELPKHDAYEEAFKP
jgi:D-3-phosphoglycerate dehydrogenase